MVYDEQQNILAVIYFKYDLLTYSTLSFLYSGQWRIKRGFGGLGLNIETIFFPIFLGIFKKNLRLNQEIETPFIHLNALSRNFGHFHIISLVELSLYNTVHI